MYQTSRSHVFSPVFSFSQTSPSLFTANESEITHPRSSNGVRHRGVHDRRAPKAQRCPVASQPKNMGVGGGARLPLPGLLQPYVHSFDERRNSSFTYDVACTADHCITYTWLQSELSHLCCLFVCVFFFERPLNHLLVSEFLSSLLQTETSLTCA